MCHNFPLFIGTPVKIGLNLTVCLKVSSPVTFWNIRNEGFNLGNRWGWSPTPNTGMGSLLNCMHVARLLSSNAVWPHISTSRVPLSRHPCQPLLAEQFSILLAKWGRDTTPLRNHWHLARANSLSTECPVYCRMFSRVPALCRDANNQK